MRGGGNMNNDDETKCKKCKRKWMAAQDELHEMTI